MQQWLTGVDLANWLGMARLTDGRAFVIVEGPTDAQALDPHVDNATAVTFPAHGKQNAEHALEECDARGTGCTLAVLDRDWFGVLAVPVSSTNLVYSDDYDLDATILLSEPVLTRVITSQTDKAARERYLEKNGRSLSDIVISLAAPVGAMRLVNERDNYGLRCEGFPVYAALDSECARVNVTQMCAVAVRRSKNACVQEARLEAEVARICGGPHGLRRICNGHDVAAAVAAMVKHLGGPLLSGGGVEAIARAAFSWADLAATRLYRDVASWAAANNTHVWWSEQAE